MCQALIVEDNAMFRQSLKDLLCMRFPSLNVDEAADGGEALRKVDSFTPDLIFMDIRLPGANGLELTRKIRASDDRVVVVVLTSYDFPEYREAAYRSGANYFFTKGTATAEEIASLVEVILSTKEPGLGLDRTASLRS